MGEGFRITSILLRTSAEVPGIDEAKFREFAEGAKKGCPVSPALAGTDLDAHVVGDRGTPARRCR